DHECHFAYLKRRDELLGRVNPTGSVLCLEAGDGLERSAVARFAAHVARIAPDAVVAANPYALAYSALALRRARMNAARVPTYHSTELSAWAERLKMLAWRPFFWGADCTVFVSERQRRYCMRRGVLSRRNAVIHNGVDVGHYRAAGDLRQQAAAR